MQGAIIENKHSLIPHFHNNKGDIMEDTVLVKEKSGSRASVDSKTTVSAEVDKVIIGSYIVLASVVGLWVVACLVSAMIQAGGPIQLLIGYFQALAG